MVVPSESSKRVKQWLHADKQIIDNMPEDALTSMQQMVETEARSQQAEKRSQDWAAIAKYQPSSEAKNLVKVFITLLGAVTFSAAPGLIGEAMGRGPLGVSAGLAGGALATYLVDDRATRVFTGVQLKKRTEIAIKAVAAEQENHPPKNQLGVKYFQAKRSLTLEIEGENLDEPSKLDIAIAGGLTVVEMATVFWVVLPAGFLIALLSAGFPVTVIWAAAAIQAERFELPEKSIEFKEKYNHVAG